ncbi:MAG: hypothetical protein ACRDZP_09385, partial [Acidimicrobiales bacterium]
LREELLPALQAMPGFDSALLMTAHEHGRGLAIVVFDSAEAAASLGSGFTLDQELRHGVSVTAADVLEIALRG